MSRSRKELKTKPLTLQQSRISSFFTKLESTTRQSSPENAEAISPRKLCGTPDSEWKTSLGRKPSPRNSVKQKSRLSLSSKRSSISSDVLNVLKPRRPLKESPNASILKKNRHSSVSAASASKELLSPDKPETKRRRGDILRPESPDLFSGTPPDMLEQRNPKATHPSPKRRTFSCSKQTSNNSTLKIVKDEDQHTVAPQIDGNVINRMGQPSEVFDSDNHGECKDQLAKEKQNSSSEKSYISMTVISPIKTVDDEILKNILEQISPKRHYSNMGKRKLDLSPSHYMQTGVHKSPRINISPIKGKTEECSSKAEMSTNFAKATSPKPKTASHMSYQLNKPLRRSPRKHSVTHFLVDLSKSPAKLKATNLLPLSQIVKGEELSLNSGDGSKNLVDNESADLQKVFSTSNDMENVIKCEDGWRKAIFNKEKKELNSLKKSEIPLRRSPRKLEIGRQNLVGRKSATPSVIKAQENYRTVSEDCNDLKLFDAHVKNSTLENDLADLHLIFEDDHNSLEPAELVVWNTGPCFGNVRRPVNPNIDCCQHDMTLLDLHQPQVCKVTSVKMVTLSREAVLHLSSLDGSSKAECRVKGSWLNSPVFEGDVISIEAKKVKGEWLLDDKAGLIVLHPDLLISGTTIVGSLFCARRSVLSSLYRGIESDSAIMVVGSIVHELLQLVLQQKKFSQIEVKQVAEQLIASRKCIRMLYASKMSKTDIMKELDEFVPRIAAFMSTYVSFPVSKSSKRKGELLSVSSASVSASCSSRMGTKLSSDWNGKIIGIRDIEETLWEPRLGIKGMVDVSVDVQDGSGKKKSMPLELKTGKASFSAEHKGQVTLYSMMMSRMGMDVVSGLLLYLREGRMEEVALSHNERKDLIRLRNTLSEFLLPRTPTMKNGKFTSFPLPEPISFASACQKCPYVTLCSVHLKLQGLSKLPVDHPMVSLSSVATQHLSQDHVDYVIHWAGLLQLEDMERIHAKKIKNFWRFPPKERERNKQAIANLHLKAPGLEIEGKYSHELHRKTLNEEGSPRQDLKECGLGVGDYIIISTDKRLAIDHGSIAAIGCSSVTIVTNRSLFEKFGNETFHIDCSESNTILVFNLTNLGCLLDDTERAIYLRNVIIDRKAPTFNTPLNTNVITSCLGIFKRLNKSQQQAILKTLKADDYLLIKGLPGTGKTATLVALVEVLARAGLSVLITSHTHSAVDNLLLRLKAVGLQFLRLGSEGRVHPELHAFCENTITKHCKTPEDMDCILSKQKIVAVTCLGAGHALFSRGHVFDVCLVDESTQVSQPTILRPLFSARRFVLIGDPHQLPPVVRSHQAQELGLSESLFARLESPTSTVSLNVNYRMNRVITKLANSLTYGGELTCGNEKVAEATLQLLKPKASSRSWLSAPLSPDIEKSVVFIDTSVALCTKPEVSEAAEESACLNHLEVQLAMTIVGALIERGIKGSEIGIIAPYRAQVALLLQTMEITNNISGVEINTVDQFQGRDKQVILYSCTRSDGLSHQNPKDREILNDPRRLTVAITRAKHKLIIIGHVSTLKLYAPFKKLLASLSESNIISVNEN